jgi:hypothetical protein
MSQKDTDQNRGEDAGQSPARGPGRGSPGSRAQSVTRDFLTRAAICASYRCCLTTPTQRPPVIPWALTATWTSLRQLGLLAPEVDGLETISKMAAPMLGVNSKIQDGGTHVAELVSATGGKPRLSPPGLCTPRKCPGDMRPPLPSEGDGQQRLLFLILPSFVGGTGFELGALC